MFYDDNLISLDGPTELSYTEDVTKRFEAYGWHVQMVSDGNDLVALEKAALAAKAETTKPSLIRVRTVIGYGSPKAGTQKVHGEALGKEAMAATRKNLGWPDDTFYIPEDAGKNWLQAVDKGAKAQAEWQATFEKYKKAYPELGEQYTRTTSMKLAEGWEKAMPCIPNRQTDGNPECRRHRAQRNRQGCAGALRRRSRPYQLNENHLQRLAQLPCRPQGPQHFLRRA